MTYSEFGRRPAENASGGTDHGAAAPLFVAGPPVKGGQFYGDEPSLTALDPNGNLKYNVDFRSVYATVLERIVGTDPAPILGGQFSPIPFVCGRPRRRRDPAGRLQEPLYLVDIPARDAQGLVMAVDRLGVRRLQQAVDLPVRIVVQLDLPDAELVDLRDLGVLGELLDRIVGQREVVVEVHEFGHW
jgi:hypothetical protein